MGHCLQFSVYRKPTHSNSYLHYFSFSHKSIKLGLAQSLFLRALRVCCDDFLTEEINFITNLLKQLAYPDKILKNALTKAKRTFFRSKTQLNVNSDIIPVSRPSHKLVLPFVKSIQQYKTHLKHFNTDLIFTHKNKLKTQLSHNKPPSLIESGVYSYLVMIVINLTSVKLAETLKYALKNTKNTFQKWSIQVA